MSPDYFAHFNKGSRNYSKVKQVMKLVDRVGRKEGVWQERRSDWDTGLVTTLWSTIWHRLDPYICTEALILNDRREDKSRKGELVGGHATTRCLGWVT